MHSFFWVPDYKSGVNLEKLSSNDQAEAPITMDKKEPQPTFVEGLGNAEVKSEETESKF